jgi:hypothetical protein
LLSSALRSEALTRVGNEDEDVHEDVIVELDGDGFSR